MTRRGRIAAAIIAFGGALAIAIALTRARPRETPEAAARAANRPVPVATAIAAARDVPVLIDGLGTVRPLATVLVRTQVDGRLDKVSFREGQAVKRGDPLALVDPRPFEIQIAQGEAALARDRSTLAQAELDLRRYTALVRDSLIPQQQVDQQRVTRDQAAAAVRTDEATIRTASLNREYAHITSPINGVTGLRQVDPGNIVHPGDASGIVFVTQLDPIGVIFTLPQDVLPKVQEALSHGRPSVVAYARDAETRLGEGMLELLDNQVVQDTATIRLKAVLPNPTNALWPNQFVKARLHLETIPHAVVVPASAITRGPQGTLVYVVDEQGTANPRGVTVLRVQGEDAILGPGLSGGEVVVTDGQTQLRPGAKVAPRPQPAARLQ
jgi:multidrug efflux system membrane fusion protein